MTRRIIEEKISNLVRVAPSPYPFCLAWSITFVLIKLVFAWHIPFTAYDHVELKVYFIIFVVTLFGWSLRLIVVKPKISSILTYIAYAIGQYERYGWADVYKYRTITFWEFSYGDGSDIYDYSELVIKNYFTGFFLFLWSEFMIFFSLWWGWCHNAFSPSIWIGAHWPPVFFPYFKWRGTSAYMTIVLFVSSCLLNWADLSLRVKATRTLLVSILSTVLALGLYFLELQTFEYIRSVLSYRDSIYGCLFFSITGLHGLHVIIGMFFILLTVIRITCDAYIRQDGLSYKYYTSKNIDFFYNFKVCIIKTFQLITSRHLVSNVVVYKLYDYNLMALLLSFPSIFRPNNFILNKLFNLRILYSRHKRFNYNNINLLDKQLIILRYLSYKYKSKAIVLWSMKFILFICSLFMTIIPKFYYYYFTYINPYLYKIVKIYIFWYYSPSNANSILQVKHYYFRYLRNNYNKWWISTSNRGRLYIINRLVEEFFISKYLFKNMNVQLLIKNCKQTLYNIEYFWCWFSVTHFCYVLKFITQIVIINLCNSHYWPSMKKNFYYEIVYYSTIISKVYKILYEATSDRKCNWETITHPKESFRSNLTWFLKIRYDLVCLFWIEHLDLEVELDLQVFYYRQILSFLKYGLLLKTTSSWTKFTQNFSSLLLIEFISSILNFEFKDKYLIKKSYFYLINEKKTINRFLYVRNTVYNMLIFFISYFPATRVGLFRQNCQLYFISALKYNLLKNEELKTIYYFKKYNLFNEISFLKKSLSREYHRKYSKKPKSFKFIDNIIKGFVIKYFYNPDRQQNYRLIMGYINKLKVRLITAKFIIIENYPTKPPKIGKGKFERIKSKVNRL